MKRLIMGLLATTTAFTGSFFVDVPTGSFSDKFNSASNSFVSIFDIPSAEARNRQGSRRVGGYTSSGRGSRYVGGR